MTSRESQLTGRLRLRHLLEVTEAVEETMVDERARFTALRRDSSATRAVSAFNLFQTPPTIADAMVGRIADFGRALEPSAGLGRIYQAIRKRHAGAITLIEQSPDVCRELFLLTDGDSASTLLQGDFLAMKPGQFDTIIMNPPFKNGTDIKHIRHALTMLAPGGTLVSLCANGHGSAPT